MLSVTDFGIWHAKAHKHCPDWQSKMKKIERRNEEEEEKADNIVERLNRRKVGRFKKINRCFHIRCGKIRG